VEFIRHNERKLDGMTPEQETPPVDDVLDQLRHAPGPLSVVDIRSGRVTACNEAFAALLSLGVDSTIGREIPSLIAPDDRPGIEAVFTGFASGVLDCCTARARLVSPGGEVVEVLISVGRNDAGRPPRQVVLAVAPAHTATEPHVLRGEVDATRLALCVVDDGGRLSEISEDAKELLGWDGHHRGTSLHESVHPDDAPLLQLAMGRSAVDRRATSIALRLLGGSGQWTPVRCDVSPLTHHKPPRYAMALRSSRTAAEQPTERANRLESHLWRIALEVQAAGIGARPGLAQVWWNDPALAGLSDRQSEVLRRIVQGERIPAIARELFITESTVRNHLSGLYQKLGVHSQAELMARLTPRLSDETA
jgi:DNA-binding CsgD family transcriptional regulator